MADGRIAVDQTIAWHLDLSTGVVEWLGYDEAGAGARHGAVPVRQLILDPQASASLDRVMMQCASLGQPFQEAIAYTMSDGRDVCLNVAGHLLVTADGTPGAIVGLAIASVGGSHFATAQVQPRAVTALHDFGRFGTLEFDVIGRTVRISDGMYRLLRLDPSVPVDIDTIRALMHGEDSDSVQQAVEIAMRSRRPTTFDWRLATSPGQHRVMRTWMRFSYGADDRLERIVGMVEDVTELVRERSARIAAEGKHRRIFESAPMGMAVVGARGADEGIVVEANDAFLAIVGGTRAEIVGSPLDRVSRRFGPFSALMAKLERDAVVEIPVTSLRADTAGVLRWVKGQVTTVDAGSELLLVQIDDVTAMVEAEARLQHLADIDDLTGLVNRRRFRELLDEALRDCAANRSCASLLLLDVDRFKWVNDSRGHQAGDHLLRQVADVVRRALPDATVGRIAGDEFAVLLRGTDVQDASACAERLRRELHETLIDDGTGRPHHITVTVGVAALDGGGDIDRALIAADLAMYQGKQRGRNRVEVISNPDINQRMSTSVSWAERVRQALRDGAFELWQQPIINLRTRRIGKRELLLRMVGPDGERIAAGEFMTAAEDFGLAPEVDSWVLEHVAPLVHDHRRRESGVLLTINLSAQSIVDPSLVRRIDAALADRGVDPTEIMFEITETAAIADLDAAEALVRTLRDRDYGISIDDFGVGYGSFTYLERLPFECVKIDRSLSSKVTLHRDRRLPVQAMVLIARGLGRKTVAEGVEDAATAAMLKRLGVDYGQGYFFGQPAPWPPFVGDVASG